MRFTRTHPCLVRSPGHHCVVIFGITSLLSLSGTGCDMSSHGGWRLAEYKNFDLESSSITRPHDPDDEKFTALSTDRGVNYTELAAIYVQLPGGERHLLEDLPEEEVAKYFARDDRVPARIGQCYTNGSHKWTFVYRDGDLFIASLETTDSVPIAFSTTKEGPYVKLPITRRTMVEMFGEPVKWGSYRPASGP